MRSAMIAAAFAATAIAVPLQERDVVYATDVEMVYVTQYYTVTADGAEPTKQAVHYGHGNHQPHWWHGPFTNKGHTAQPEPTSEPEPSPADPPHTIYNPPPAPTHEPPATHKPPPTNTGWGNPEPTSEPPSSTPPSSPGQAPSDYQGMVLYHHNIHRKNHTSPDIQWSSSLASTAQKIAQTCQYAHNTEMDGGGYGQNIAAGVDPSGIDRVITNMFYDSEVMDFAGNYGNDHPSGFETWGHFTQMIWINTREVACYTQDCTSKGLGNVGGNVPAYFTVCNYSPPGNVAGAYADNVKESIHMAPVVV